MAKLIIGQPAPDFHLADLQGQPVSLADFGGKMVLLNFWSAECPHAARADAVIRGLSEWLVVLTIASNTNEALDLVRSTAEERMLAVVLPDPRQEVADLYGAETTPHLFLIDAGGLLRYQGALDDVTFRRRSATRFYLKEAVEALLSGGIVAEPETPPYGCTIVRTFTQE
ncbi:MAG: redoxin domain-containing protein [Anaerolineaceae bacterium]|nr:redoxin domain-containing protein [Anaerolineaceae bacterium]